ncbi:hypothetical protein HWV01_02090 [Moritella sp. 5]|uniref:hypothetical protein n=1 Tax=Moritella sp. 5 TaxID=2746231 RepID=UPI001BACE577|nr:hypothetical protein [Moritella sp. 5]QUM79200.1 hypothetical protein HWV01_02090 [Moritella sp. 5]
MASDLVTSLITEYLPCVIWLNRKRTVTVVVSTKKSRGITKPIEFMLNGITGVSRVKYHTFGNEAKSYLDCKNASDELIEMLEDLILEGQLVVSLSPIDTQKHLNDAFKEANEKKEELALI